MPAVHNAHVIISILQQNENDDPVPSKIFHYIKGCANHTVPHAYNSLFPILYHLITQIERKLGPDATNKELHTIYTYTDIHNTYNNIILKFQLFTHNTVSLVSLTSQKQNYCLRDYQEFS